eukprot:15479257-Alexandrium_andersonii.AAC.1
MEAPAHLASAEYRWKEGCRSVVRRCVRVAARFRHGPLCLWAPRAADSTVGRAVGLRSAGL